MTKDHKLLELIRDLARILSLEYGNVDDHDLGSIKEGIEILERARTEIEACGLETPEATRMILDHYAAHNLCD